MERSVAIKKLGKLLGKSLGYRVDTRAPTADERLDARAALGVAREELSVVSSKIAERREAILSGDHEYQALKVKGEAARKRVDKLTSITSHYKITVGITSSMFFHVRAQGDTWEQVIAKLEKASTT